jgi:hypothetical protein
LAASRNGVTGNRTHCRSRRTDTITPTLYRMSFSTLYPKYVPPLVSDNCQHYDNAVYRTRIYVVLCAVIIALYENTLSLPVLLGAVKAVLSLDEADFNIHPPHHETIWTAVYIATPGSSPSDNYLRD